MQGLHLTADLRGVDPALALMQDLSALESACDIAVAHAGLTAVTKLFHRFSPDDAQSGITGVVLLAESHVAVHTWPELGGVTLDVYVCNYGGDNSAKARALMAHLVQSFGAAQVQAGELRRAALG